MSGLPMDSQESVPLSEEWATESSEEEDGGDYHNYYGDEDPDASCIVTGKGG